MAEQEENNLSKEEFVEIELEDDFVPADAQPVCPKCFEPCNRLQNYCDKCDSNEVINPLACYMPFVRIRLNVGMLGRLGRRIWSDKQTPFFWKVIFLILIIIAVIIYPRSLCYRRQRTEDGGK